MNIKSLKCSKDKESDAYVSVNSLLDSGGVISEFDCGHLAADVDVEPHRIG